jgi:hypothetical protein
MVPRPIKPLECPQKWADVGEGVLLTSQDSSRPLGLVVAGSERLVDQEIFFAAVMARNFAQFFSPAFLLALDISRNPRH